METGAGQGQVPVPPQRVTLSATPQLESLWLAEGGGQTGGTDPSLKGSRNKAVTRGSSPPPSGGASSRSSQGCEQVRPLHVLHPNSPLS